MTLTDSFVYMLLIDYTNSKIDLITLSTRQHVPGKCPSMCTQYAGIFAFFACTWF